MKLYHFASAGRLAQIMDDGYLKVTESNMSRTREHAGPDVVWLTSDPDPSAQPWKSGAPVDKTAVRFTVDVPKREAQRWRGWATRRGIDPRWLKNIAASGGSGRWYVIERPVPRAEWIEIVHTATGAIIDDPRPVAS